MGGLSFSGDDTSDTGSEEKRSLATIPIISAVAAFRPILPLLSLRFFGDKLSDSAWLRHRSRSSRKSPITSSLSFPQHSLERRIWNRKEIRQYAGIIVTSHSKPL
jgi:hypothetical protein